MTFLWSLYRVWCLSPSFVPVKLRAGNLFKNKSINTNSTKCFRCARFIVSWGELLESTSLARLLEQRRLTEHKNRLAQLSSLYKEHPQGSETLNSVTDVRCHVAEPGSLKKGGGAGLKG